MKSLGRTDYTSIHRVKPLSPRLKNAIRLYTTGIAHTKAQAARIVGLSPATVYIATAPIVSDPKVNQLTNDTDKMVADATISTRVLIEKLSRKAIGKLGNLMDTGEDDSIRLRAAIDLADRGQETSKIQRLQVESLHLTREDNRALAEAMVRAAEVKGRYAHLADANFITLDGGLDGQGNGEGTDATEGRQGTDDAEGRQGGECSTPDGWKEGKVIIRLLGPGDGD